MTSINSQNPYHSFIVAASAGTGKTYQLTKRFLNLVSAGANPSSILTITFTKKAANEMRTRILEQAAELLVNQEKQLTFDKAIAHFYQHSADKMQSSPRLAHQTANLILAQTQRLKITTIDSIFLDWVKKFTFEINSNLPEPIIPERFELAELADIHKILENAYDLMFAEQSALIPELLAAVPDALLTLKQRLAALHASHTFLWLAQLQRADASAFIKHLTVPCPFPTAALLMSHCQPALQTIAQHCDDLLKEKILVAFDDRSLARLLESGLLTKDLRISRRYLNNKKQELLTDEINLVENCVLQFVNQQNIDRLNQIGEIYLALYGYYQEQISKLKQHSGVVQFSDLAMGSYQIFTNPFAAGARFLIHQNTEHLLLDEFQDTSELQWFIFNAMANELLSGHGITTQRSKLPPSVFIVGDEKQSIYGFREANPKIMKQAENELISFGANKITLNDNYRSSQLILDIVNELCSSLFIDFPIHQQGRNADQETFLNYSHCLIAQPFQTNQNTELDATEQEAQFVAQCIEHILANPEQYPVYHEESKSYRYPQPKDFAILYRFSTQSQQYEHALRQRNIPCIKEQSSGFFQRTEILDMIALLKYLSFQTDLLSLLTVLKSPIGNVNDHHLHRLIAASTTAKPKLDYQVLLKSFADLAPETAACLLQLSNQAHSILPSQLFAQCCHQLQLFKRYTVNINEEQQQLIKANISQFYYLLVDLERKGARSLPIALERLAQLQNYSEVGDAVTQPNTVQLMTIHKAKGLEFPFVIVVDTATKWQKRDRYWAKIADDYQNLGIYYMGTKSEQPVNHQPFDEIYQRLDNDLKEEACRLIYVALTRAKQYLFITAHQNNQQSDQGHFNKLITDAFLALKARQTSCFNTQCYTLTTTNHLVDKMSQGQPSSKIQEGKIVTANILHHLPSEIITLRPTAALARNKINHLKSRPQNLTPQHWKGYGQFVHKCLELKIKGISFNPKLYWQKFAKDNQIDLDHSMALYQQGIAEVDNVLQLKALKQLLANAVVIKPEMPVLTLNHNQLIRGYIDLCIETSTELIVIDYKTIRLPQLDALQLDKHDLALRKLCDDQGYTDQVYSYCNILKSIHPQKLVSGYILFTATGQLTKILIKE